MARPRFSTIIPSAGLAAFPGALFTHPSFRDYDSDPDASSPVKQAVDEVITFADSAEGLYRLDFVPAGDPDGLQSDGSAVLEVWSGQLKTGTQFALINEGTAFGAASLRQARVYPGSSKIDFSLAQMTDAGWTQAYASYGYTHSWPDASTLAQMTQEIIAAQRYAWGYLEIQSLEALTVGYGYIDPGPGKVKQLASLLEPSHVCSAVWVLEACDAFATAKVAYRARVAQPVGVSIPIGKDVYIGNNSLPTYVGDSSGNAINTGNGEISQFSGKVYEAGFIHLDLNTPLGGTL